MAHSEKMTRSIGEWRPAQDIVHISQQRGRHWSTHGHVHEGSTILLPEEALFLMECGVLEVFHEGKPLSLQQAYHSLLCKSTLALYQVFASLKRIGYIAYKVYLPRSCVRQDGLMKAATPLVTLPACGLCTAAAPPLSSKAPGPHDTGSLVMLEVHRPSGSKKGTPFRKSQPGPPDFRLLVARADEEFPSAERVRALCSIQPHCPLRVCVVEGPNLAYYTLTPS